MKFLVTIISILIFSALAYGQGVPDLSGTWVVDKEKTDLGFDKGPLKISGVKTPDKVLVIQQRGSDIFVIEDGKPLEQLDGKWTGSTYVTETKTKGMRAKAIWELSKDGATLTRRNTIEFDFGPAPAPGLWVFQKKVMGPTIAPLGFVNGVQMTSVKAPWVLRILGQDLDFAGVQTRPTDQATYFMMTSEATKLNVSVFVEPVDKCKTADECRDLVLNGGNPSWGKYQDLAKGKIGDASYFEFYRPEVEGRPAKILDMYAEFVVDGYWVDMHISKVLYQKKDHALFETVVKEAKFVPKNDKVNSAFMMTLNNGSAAASSWLGLWESPKCAEMYKGLSPLVFELQATNREKGWMEFCEKQHGDRGSLKSRQLLGAAFTNSVPGKIDQPVAILAYQSDFANQSLVVELIGLVLEKDGRWTITSYHD